VRVSFGSLYTYPDWTATSNFEAGNDWMTASNSGSVNVVEGQSYQIHVEYFHGTGEAGLELRVSRPISVDASFNIVSTKAAAADVIVFVGGITASLEGEEMPVTIEGFAGGDRTLIELPRPQRDFLERIKAIGKPVVFIVCAGSAIAFDPTGLNAVVDAFYPGQAGGTAVADVVFGQYNPAGRLPVTFYASTGELDDFADYNMATAKKGRTYRYYKGKALYPFGHGLSYTKFEYGNLQVTGNPVNGENVSVSFELRNAGAVDGDEVSQLYVSAVGVAGEPIKALKWFQRKLIKAGAREVVQVSLSPDAFSVFDEEANALVVKEGSFKVAVGGCSGDDAQTAKDVSFSASGDSGETGNLQDWELAVIIIAVIVVVIAVVAVIAICKRHDEGYQPTDTKVSQFSQ
jgi:beta-glucosidase